MTAATWNSLEVAKLVVSILTPLAVFFLALVTARLARTAQNAQSTNQKLLDRRLEAYDAIAPPMNEIRDAVSGRAPTSLAEDERTYQEKLAALTASFRTHRHLFDRDISQTFDQYRWSVEQYLNALNDPEHAGEVESLRHMIVQDDQALLDAVHDDLGWPRRDRSVWSWGSSSDGDF